MKRFSLIREAADLFVFVTGIAFLTGITGVLILRYEELIRILANGG